MNADVSKMRRWTKKEAWGSALLFLLNLFILLLIVAALLVGGNLGNLKQTLEANKANYVYIAFCLSLLVIITYFYFFFEERGVLSEGKNIMLLFTILDVSLILCVLTGKWLNVYSRPVALCALLTFLLLGRRSAMFMNIISALTLFIVDNFSTSAPSPQSIYSALMIAFTAGMVAIFAANRLRSRLRVVLVGIIIALPMDFMIFLLEISSVAMQGTAVTQEGVTRNIWVNLGFGFAGGISSAILFLLLLPVFEFLFSVLTVFRLRELTSLDSTLLKKLKEEAPGTYNHSAVVSQLAEECAVALGEDAELARAAALYHDVGKLHHPEYFSENQGDYNLHDELTPELSADIIRSHTSDGHDLILANHLPQFFADVAIQHHGTLTMGYFYGKAQKMYGGEVNKEDFSYVGPKPKSKIAAIIMVADAAEAVTRSMVSKKPEDVEKRVRGIIEERMNQEQFAECNITMEDLTVLRITLVSALTGVYHKRVEYPSIHYGKKEEE